MNNKNFVFISPHFPYTYWQFCQRLKANGMNVLGIADAGYDSLSEDVKSSLTEYYRVDSLEDYDQVYRAVAYFAHKYGRIDWIESNNEHWLEQDARLRTDFNVTTGINSSRIVDIKEKSAMKRIYLKHKIPTARQQHASAGLEAALTFVGTVGYSLIAKPDKGVGATGVYKIDCEEDLRSFFENEPHWQDYVFEEFITGDICSYDAITDERCEPIFEAMTVWPPSIMDIVNKQLDLAYYVDKELPAGLKKLGRKTAKAFGVKNRYIHLEFFRLDSDRPSLGRKGDFVALEVNMRPAGGPSPDMVNYAFSTDVYKIWADMVAFGRSDMPVGQKCYCVYASRRDIYAYIHSHEDVLQRYGDRMVMCQYMPKMYWPSMGQQMYMVKLDTKEELNEFVRYVHEKK